MTISETLWMTKPKLIILFALLIALLPKYYEFNCTKTTCGFSFPNFFTIFVLAYITACVIGELYELIKKTGKNKTK